MSSFDSAPPIFAERYKIVSMIAQGGMGRIYKAYDELLQRFVALKFVHSEDPEWERRFLQEAQAQAKVDHDFVCKIFDMGRADGRSFIAMQYIEGQPFLSARSWDFRKKADLVKHVADAMHAAHSTGLIHRDIKPSNILLYRTAEGEDRPCILDFGLVRDTTRPDQSRTGTIHGTPHYMSPEQAKGEVHKVDARSDVYSIGATFYELLSGRPPFEGTGIDILIKVMHEDPLQVRKVAPESPEELETIVMKCLEKEPDRRYQTAKDLSDDLERYLQNEPIHARQSTWTYRAVKKVKKYRLFSELLAVALLLVLAAIGLAVHTWWRGHQQIEIANQFAQEVRYIEDTLRYAYSAPLHDVRKEEEMVIARLSVLQKKINERGRIARGPGFYALGRVHLALHNYTEARNFLEQSWNQYDYKLPHVAYALGLSLAMLYRNELKETDKITNNEVKESQKKEIEKRYRDPALEFLRKGASASADSREYVEAIVAFLSKEYDKTLQRAEKSLQQFPWLYAARKIMGDAFLAIANEKRDRGEREAAVVYYGKAAEAYKSAAESGKSDSDLYSALCGLQVDVMRFQMHQTDLAPKEAFEEAIAACNSALIADPENGVAHASKAAAFLRRGEFRFQTGQDPREDLEKAIELGKRAVDLVTQKEAPMSSVGMAYEVRAEFELRRGLDPWPSLHQALENYKKALSVNPSYIRAQDGIGGVYWIAAQYQAQRGEDPTDSLNKSIESFQRTITIHPDFAYSYSNVGGTYIVKAGYQTTKGIDPRPSYDSAVKYFEKALSINPQNVAVFTNTASAYIQKGLYELAHGLDPRSSAEKAIDNIRKALTSNPKNHLAFSDLGAAYSLKSQYEIKQGLDPTNSLEAAIANLSQSVSISPSYPYSYMNLASVWIDAAGHQLDRGLDPGKSIAAGKQATAKAMELNANHPYPYWTAGLLENLEGRSLAKKGRAPDAGLQRAREAFKKALQLNPQYPEALLGLAETELCQAEWRARQNAPVETNVQQGLQWIEQALAINPKMADAFATQALLLRVIAGKDPSAASRAEESLQKAIEINPNLKRKYE